MWRECTWSFCDLIFVKRGDVDRGREGRKKHSEKSSPKRKIAMLPVGPHFLRRLAVFTPRPLSTRMYKCSVSRCASVGRPCPAPGLVAARRVTASARRRIGTAASRDGDDGELCGFGAIVVMFSERRGGGRRPSARETALPPKRRLFTRPPSPQTHPSASAASTSSPAPCLRASPPSCCAAWQSTEYVWGCVGWREMKNDTATLARSHNPLPQPL